MVNSMMQSAPPVVVQPPYLLFLAKIVPSIAVIVSRFNVLHVHAAMTPAVIVGAIAMAVMVVAGVVIAAMAVVVTGVIVAGKKASLLDQRVIHCGLPSRFILDMLY